MLKSSPIRNRSVPIVLWLLVQTGLFAAALDRTASEDLAAGKRLFDGQCARCHGIGGTGGQGPSLARPNLVHAVQDEEVFSVIKNGIPGTGMPEIWMMTDHEIWQVVRYIRSLGRISRQIALPGNPSKGRLIFESKGGCLSCHIVSGKGGNRGPELTDIGVRRGPDYLRTALIAPAAALPQGLLPDYTGGYSEFLPVSLVTRDGREVRGIRVNEDTFSIQIRDTDNQFQSFEKTHLKALRREFGKSPMPSYEQQLTPPEIDDLVAYLASLRGTP